MEKSRNKRRSALSLKIFKKTESPCPNSQGGTGLLKAKTLNNELSIQIDERYPAEFDENFEVLSQIGKGCQGGVVLSVKEKETGQIFAAKIYRTRDEERISLIRNENQILSQLNHKVFPAYKSFIEDLELGYFIIITEFCPYISLDAYLSTFTPSSLEAKIIVSQLEEGLKILKQQSILHRDLNPTNVLIDPETCSVKIIDFGISRILNKFQNVEEMDKPEGNTKYRAPMIDGVKNMFFEDDWGFSCIALSIFWHEKVTSKKLLKIVNEAKKNEKKLVLYEEASEIVQNVVKILS